MQSELLSLGIDTSNYKTSVAVVDCSGKVLFNHQEYLEVKKGERGLRQSEAFFQHVQRLPDAIQKALSDFAIRENIGAVSFSTRPRPIEGSYMPVLRQAPDTARRLRQRWAYRITNIHIRRDISRRFVFIRASSTSIR